MITQLQPGGKVEAPAPGPNPDHNGVESHDQLELMTRGFVDDYRAKLNGRWAAEHEADQ
jgi:hypothetical protein